MSRRPAPGLTVIVLAALAVAGGACTDTELRCISADCQVAAKSVTDNIVHAQGKVCTRDPNTSTYPYKVILVVDISGSTTQSDPDTINGRYKAVQKVLTDPNYLNNPLIQFAVISFASDPTVLQGTFTADRKVLQTAVAPLFDDHAAAATAGTYQPNETDYLKALKAVEQVITNDATIANPSERAYTQYDVQWLSDGNPEINPDTSSTDVNDPALITHCSEDIPTVLAETKTLANLATTLGAYSVSFSAIFLDAQPAYVSPCAPFVALNPARWGDGPSYLTKMVDLFTPKGTYHELSADKLEFDIHVNTLSRRYEQNNFFLVNYSRVVEGNQLLPDSDQDGIPDSREQAFGLDATTGHSDASTLCSDLARYRTADNPNLCINSCKSSATSTLPGLVPTLDQDGDTLLNCEEGAISTAPNLIDTDGDNLTDDIELRFDSDPLAFTDNRLDNDRDGIYDFDEVILGLNPKSSQPDRSFAYSYVPLQTATGDASQGVTCYTFQVDNVQLAATEASDVAAKGENKLCLFLVQHPINNPNSQPTISRACKTANFQLDPNGLGIKDPANGIVQFDDSDFSVVMCADASCKVGASVTSPGLATGGQDSNSTGAATAAAVERSVLGAGEGPGGEDSGAAPTAGGSPASDAAVLPRREGAPTD